MSHNQCSSSSKVINVVEVELCVGQAASTTPTLAKHVFKILLALQWLYYLEITTSNPDNAINSRKKTWPVLLEREGWHDFAPLSITVTLLTHRCLRAHAFGWIMLPFKCVKQRKRKSRTNRYVVILKHSMCFDLWFNWS